MENHGETRAGSGNLEQSIHKEIQYILEADAMTISGPSGSGKSTQGKYLAKDYGISLYQAGGDLRKKVREEQHQEIVGAAIRTVDEDKSIDERTEDLVRTSPTEKKIIEARLGGYTASNIIHKMLQAGETPPKVIKILIKADLKTRIDRIYQRQVLENPNLTREEVEHATQIRDVYDLLLWRISHPGLIDKDPFDENLTDDFGNKVYDLVIDTTNMTPDEAAVIVHDTLVQKGLVRHIDSNPIEEYFPAA